MPETDPSQYGGQSDAWSTQQAVGVPAPAPDPAAKLADQQAKAAAVQDRLNQDSPNWAGPGYVLGYDGSGDPVLRVSTNPADRTAHDQWVANGSPRGGATPAPPGPPGGIPPMPAVPAPSQAVTPFAPGVAPAPVPQSRQAFQAAPIVGPGVSNGGAPASAPLTRTITPAFNPFTGTPSGVDTAAAQAPKIDTSKADAALAGVQGYGSQLAELANSQLGNRKALALLADASNQAQSSAIGQARSGNFRDRAAAERGAVGEVAFTGQQAARDAATLTAQQEEADRNFKASMLEKAAGLGLNTAALQVDVSKANLDSVNNYINQQFQQFGLNKQLDVQQAGQVLQFTRDMAAVEAQYAALDEQSKEAFLNAEVQKYGVDKDYAAKMKELSKQGKVNWGQVLTGMLGNAVGGASAIATGRLIPQAQAPKG